MFNIVKVNSNIYTKYNYEYMLYILIKYNKNKKALRIIDKSI